MIRAKAVERAVEGLELMRYLRLAAAMIMTTAALAGCSIRDCAYYGGGDANMRCVITGPSPTGGYH